MGRGTEERRGVIEYCKYENCIGILEGNSKYAAEVYIVQLLYKAIKYISQHTGDVKALRQKLLCISEIHRKVESSYTGDVHRSRNEKSSAVNYFVILWVSVPRVL